MTSAERAGAGTDRLGWLLRLNRRLDEPGAALRPLLRTLPAAPSFEAFRVAIERNITAPLPGAWASDDAWLDAELAGLGRPGYFAVDWFDPAYPAALRKVHDPPLVLYGRGRRELLAHALPVAFVGARRSSDYGIAAARRLAGDAAAAGALIVSGLALGIDRAAHEAALEAGGDTIAVLGCGVDVAHPATNAKVYAAIAERGLVLAEHPLGTPPRPEFFPIRNRIIAGLSRAVVVVQAALRSGSLITARLGLEYGREVFAVPGPITSPLSEGTNRLLLDGATPGLDAGQILATLGRNPAPAAENVSVDNPPISVNISPQDRAVLDLARAETLSLDEIAERTGYPVSDVNVIATRLEAHGLVRVGAGRRLTPR